jgi:hypothetical protein
VRKWNVGREKSNEEGRDGARTYLLSDVHESGHLSLRREADGHEKRSASAKRWAKEGKEAGEVELPAGLL